MKRAIAGVVAAIGFLSLTEALTCNQCLIGVAGFCLKPTAIVCTSNTSSCFTAKSYFPSIGDILGFSSQGCLNPSLCGVTQNSTILGATYSITPVCCNEDRCNVQTNAAPDMRLSLPVALGTVLLTFVSGNVLY